MNDQNTQDPQANVYVRNDEERKAFTFQNTYKTKETQPDWRGRITFNGVEYDISGWQKTTSIGNQMIKWIVTDRPEEYKSYNKPNQAPQQTQAPRSSMSQSSSKPSEIPAITDELEDDLPF